jgi:preprotein translocase subunit SecF
MRRTNIDFVGKRKIATVASALFVLLAVGDILFQGLNWGLDFTGGTLVEVQFPEPTEPVEVRGYLEQAGLQGAIVQYFGSERDLLVRLPPQEDVQEANLGDQVLAALRESEPRVEMLQSNYVGPAVGEELRNDAGLAMLAALAVVMVYILFRFTKQFSVGAVSALAHDVVVVLGCFSLFHWTFDLSVLAAVLAVVGYSINDTIVVFDRIRENFRNMRRATPLEVVNRSINETLDRTLVTSGTTLLVLLALLVAGGETIRGFALALTIGIVVGTYSSIYVAASVALMMGISRDDLVVPEKEGEQPDRP